MKLKKCIVFILSIFLLSFISIKDIDANDKTFSVKVGEVSGKPGETVAVDVTLENNPGICSLKFKVGYDKYVTLEKVDLSKAFGDYITAPEPFQNPEPISMISPLEAVDKNGVVATLYFKISEEAVDGYSSKLSITYNPDDVFDVDLNNVNVEMLGSTISVIDEEARKAAESAKPDNVPNTEKYLSKEEVEAMEKEQEDEKNNPQDEKVVGESSNSNIPLIAGIVVVLAIGVFVFIKKKKA